MAKIKDKEIVIVNAATKALDLYSKDPYIETEKVIKEVVQGINTDNELKIIAVAAIDAVLKMKRKNPALPNKKIIQRFLDEKSYLNEEEI